jgi:hypothetical protein
VTNKLIASIPQSAVWLLRLAINPILSRTLQNDPMAFASWYATVGSVINWPEPVTRIQEGERGKRLSLDRMMKLLSQVNYAFSDRTSAGHARTLLEGYAVHEWVQRNPREFTALAASLHETTVTPEEWLEQLEIEFDILPRLKARDSYSAQRQH